MNIDIEKYLNNEMGEAERQTFERELQSDPVLRGEVDEQRVFLDRLKSQLLREKIAAAIASGGGDNPPQQTTKKSWILPLLALLLLMVIGVWYFQQKARQEIAIPIGDPPVNSSQPAEAEGFTNPPVEEESDRISPKTEQLPQRPIAEKPTVEPPANQHGVRGENVVNEDWDKLVESVWVTRFEPQPGEFNERFAPIANLLKEKNTTDVFVQLYLLERQTPENDTLAYLKGLCFLEMREGAPALEYFNKIKNKSSWSENIIWYKSLAYLINSKKDKAIQEVGLITKNKNHIFYKEAKKLLEALQ